jgi:hypothetical protein
MKTAKAIILLTLLCLAGCDAPQPAGPAAESSAPAQAEDQASRGKARQQYRAFLAEADKAAALLATHPDHDALRDTSTRLHELVNTAGDNAASNDKMAELVEEGRMAIRFFDACLKVANYQARRKDVTPEKAKSYIDKTCDGNLPAFRQSIGMLKTKFESEDAGTSDSLDKPSGAKVQETRKSSGG